MQPIPGTARSIRVSLPLSLCYRCHYLGQIVEENLFYDLVTFMRQIGMV